MNEITVGASIYYAAGGSPFFAGSLSRDSLFASGQHYDAAQLALDRKIVDTIDRLKNIASIDWCISMLAAIILMTYTPAGEEGGVLPATGIIVMSAAFYAGSIARVRRNAWKRELRYRAYPPY